MVFPFNEMLYSDNYKETIAVCNNKRLTNNVERCHIWIHTIWYINIKNYRKLFMMVECRRIITLAGNDLENAMKGFWYANNLLFLNLVVDYMGMISK